MLIIAVIALSIQMLAPYLVWRSRWNIPAHLSLGFCVTAYVIPGLLTEVWSFFSDDTINQFVAINVVGALFVCVGVLSAQILRRNSVASQAVISSAKFFDEALIVKRVKIVFTTCVIGMYLSYLIMGFMPIFADDPFSARQFKGEYRDLYYRAAYLYRFSFSIIHLTMPILLWLAWTKRSGYLVSLACLAIFALIASLSRGPMATGILLFLGIIAAKRGGMAWYIPLVVLIFPFGSLFFYWLGQTFGIAGLSDAYLGESLSDYISSGAPDIADQLNWLNGFLGGDFYSYGRTIFGGLVPGNYEWNPSIWTLTYNSIGADTSEMVTGGLRLTTAEWGYANFGWVGVVILPFTSGMLNGLMVLYLKDNVPFMRTTQIAAALIVYHTLGQQLIEFYFLSIHNIPAIAAAIYFWRAVNRPAVPTAHAAGRHRPDPALRAPDYARGRQR